MRSVVDRLRRGTAALLFVLIFGLVPQHKALASMPDEEVADPAQALEFVDGLATQAYRAMNDRTLSPGEREARAHALIEHGFNVRYMALLALGPYARDFDDKMLGDYEAKFGDLLYGKYGALVESYGVERFRTIDVEQVGRRDALVHLMIYRKGDTIDTEWRVRMFEGEPRIIDVQVSGISLTQSARADFAALIKQSGFKGLFDALTSYSGNKPV